jgi:hypothetical protein
MSRAKSGGGETMNKVVSTNAPKREPINHPVSPGAVSRLGGVVSVGTPFKPLYYNKVTASNPVGPTDGMKAGPGSNRTIMPSGSQSATPRVSSPGKSKPHW